MRKWRIAFVVAGALLGLFGAFRLVTEVPLVDVVVLAAWLVGAVVVHDGVLSPVVIAVGVALARVPARARRYLQFALITGSLVAVVGVVLVVRRGTQPRVKALLLRDYGVNLAVLLGVVAAVSLIAYAVHVARDARSRSAAAADDPPRL